MCCGGVSERTTLIWPNQYWTSRHRGRRRFPGTTHFLWNGGGRIGSVSHLSFSAQSGSGSGWSLASVIGRFQTLLQQVSLAMSGLRSEDARICGIIVPDLLKWLNTLSSYLPAEEIIYILKNLKPLMMYVENVLLLLKKNELEFIYWLFLLDSCSFCTIFLCFLCV